MSRFTTDDLDRLGWYRLLIAAVVPRPIAWITTRSRAGVVNLAPFSFFNGVTAWPPTLAVAIAHREPEKDTLRNLRETGEAVVHLIPPQLAEAANASGTAFPPEVSESIALGLETLPMPPLAVPRLAAAEVAFGCRLDRLIPVGEPATQLALLTVVCAEVAAAVQGADGLPDPDLMRTCARLGGNLWLDGDAWSTRDWPRPRIPGSTH